MSSLIDHFPTLQLEWIMVREYRQRNAQAIKVYLTLFVCMSVKAVHLEVVTDLSTDAFLAALDRLLRDAEFQLTYIQTVAKIT